VGDTVGQPASAVDPSHPASQTEGTQAGSGPFDDETPPSQPYCDGFELGGRYRLTTQLGIGGMGEVWEAEHLLLHRMVAIKLVRSDELDARHAERLQREAELIARLEHPNIVSVTDFGRAPDGRPYVVMERLRGRTLSALLRERGALPWTQARDIAVQICAGLASAHAANIIHRDLKPSNVFVLDDPHGHLPIKIIDFGLAKPTVLGPHDRALTRSGMVFGTPAYMAPEQARGETVDGGADIYAFGAILFEMIAGQRLWARGSAPQLLYCHLFEPPPSLRTLVRDVPPELEALVARCLCKDRALRFADADALRAELIAVGTGKGATVVPHETLAIPSADLQARYGSAAPARAASSHRWLLPLGALGFALCGSLGAFVIHRELRGSEVAPASPASAPVDRTPAVAAPEPTRVVTPAIAPTPVRDVPIPPVELPASDPDPSAADSGPQARADKPAAQPRRKPREKPRAPEPAKTDPPDAKTPAAEPATPKPPKRDGDTYQPFR
jgi:serine/threonine-protein kinase